MKGIIWGALGFFFLALAPGQAYGQTGEVIERVGNGIINWSQGIILAKGSGSPPKDPRNIAQARLMTERAALSDARRNLLEVLKGVRVDSATRVENFVTKDDQIRLQAEGFIQGSVEVRRFRKYLSDGAIEVTVAIDLSGDFISLLLSASEELRKKAMPPQTALAETKPEKRILPPPAPPAVPAAKPALPMEKKPEPQPPPAPPLVKEAKPVPPPPLSPPERKPEPPQPPPPPAKGMEAPVPGPATLPPFTGVVVDTRGLKMKPALAVRILTEGGRELYRGEYVPQDKAARNGLALFARDLTAAQTNPRVGKNPLTIKGSKLDPAAPSDIVLGQGEAQKMAPFAQKGTFLEDCRVMIVLD